MTPYRIRLAFALALAGLYSASAAKADYITYSTSIYSGSIVPSGGGYSLTLMNSAGPMAVGSGSGSIMAAVENTDLSAGTGGDLHPILAVTVTDVTVNKSGVILIDENTLGEIQDTMMRDMNNQELYLVTLTNSITHLDAMSPSKLDFGDGATITFSTTTFNDIGSEDPIPANQHPSSSLFLNFTSTPAITPEPSSIVLVGLGAIGAGAIALRRQRHRAG